MNQLELQQALSVSGTTLTISHDTLGSQFGNFLNLYHGGAAIVISQATLSADEQNGGVILITGTASYGNVANLPVNVRFSVNATGDVVAEFRFKMRGSLVEANTWKFSTSFPTLPTSYNAAEGKEQLLLDSLDLYDSFFVLTTHDTNDSVSGVPLAAGINFVSHLRPSGFLGVFESSVTANSALMIYGSIRRPMDGDLVVALEPEEHPWDRLFSTKRPPAPGIYLQAALDIGFQAGKLSLKNSMFRIYSPISTEWMEKNANWNPIYGFTATLGIPSAGIEVDLGADVEWGVTQALLYGNFEGVSLGKLTHLLDITGSDGLLNKLPSALQKSVDALEKLELSRVALDIVLSDGLPMVRTAFVTVGFPSLQWKVWKDDIIIESLLCRFTIFSPFALPSTTPVPALFKTRVGVTVTGTVNIEGAELAVTAGSDDGFTVRAYTLAPVNLALDKLVKSRGPGVPVPSALTINYLGVTIAPGSYYAMDALLAGTPTPWKIAVGKKSLTVSDVALQFEVAQSGSATGMFAGKIAFASNFTLNAKYSFPGGLVLRSQLPKISLGQIIDELCNQSVKLPKGLDITLDWSSILIQEQNGVMLFQLLSEVDGLGVLAFEARGVEGGQWGFAYGLDMTAGSPSKIGGLNVIGSLEKALKLQKFMLVVSSMDQPGFQLPDSAQFNNPALVTKKVSLPGSGGVTAGLNVFAEWTLDSSNKQQKMLQALLGLEGTQRVTIQVPDNPANGTKLFIGRSGKLSGHPFNYTLGMVLENGVPNLFLTGTITPVIQKQPQTFDVTTLFTASGAFMSATMKGTAPIDLGAFKLSNVAIEIGVNWSGVPSLGLTASIDVKNFSSSVAIFFDSTNPANSLVAGSISNVNAKQVLNAFIPGVDTPIDKVLAGIAVKGTNTFSLPLDLADELDSFQCDKVSAGFAAAKMSIPASSQQLAISPKKKGSSWHITDLTKMRHYQLEKKGESIQVQIAPQFYFAPQATAIGTINFSQGYYLNAAISFAGFDAEARIEIANNRGFSIDAAMDAIVIANEKLFAITAMKGDGGPQISISTMNQPDHPVEEFRKPHVYINGALSIFGLKQGIFANVTAEGVDFELVGNLLPGVHFDVDARFGKSGFGASGKLKIGIGTIDLGTLGKVKINTQLEVDIEIDLDRDTKPAAKEIKAATLSDASLSLGGSFGPDKTLLDNGLITLIFQSDGNLVLYRKNGAALWASGTQGKGGTRVDLQADGNLVIYNNSNKPVWATGTNGKGVVSLVAQIDGNLVMYDGNRKPKWDTNTDGKVNAADFDDGDDGSAQFSDDSLELGTSFGPKATLLDNGLARLVFQEDGNLCLYKAGGEYLWGSNTAGKGGKRVDLQKDGNLVIYDGSNKSVWASNTAGKGVASLVLQLDGNLVIYDANRKAKWASNTAGKVNLDDAPGITLEADFVLAGQRIDLGRFHVEMTPDTFKRLPKLLEKRIEKTLRKEFKDVAKWSNAVEDGIMDGVNDTAKVFQNVYGKSEKEAKELADGVNKGLKSATKAVNTAEKAVAKGTMKVIKKVKFW